MFTGRLLIVVRFFGFATEALGVTNEVWGVRPVRAVTLLRDSSDVFRCRHASEFRLRQPLPTRAFAAVSKSHPQRSTQGKKNPTE